MGTLYRITIGLKRIEQRHDNESMLKEVVAI